MDAAGGWPDLIHRALGELGVRQVGYVPDAGHARLIELCQADATMRPVVLTTEEEGVALLAGAWLGGERGVLLMQSSGVGNCVNPARPMQAFSSRVRKADETNRRYGG